MIKTIDQQPTNRVALEKLPQAVEVLGPAGAGKSTLARALSQRHRRIQLDIPLSRLDKIPYFIGNTLTFLPTYLRKYRHTRWFDWRENRSMAYLKAGLRAFAKRAPNSEMVVLLDHGPIYRLAFLREYGPEITTSPLYERWWSNLHRQWIATLDMVIWLDAANDVLLERIHGRDNWHLVKDNSDKGAFEFLNRYRKSFEQTMNEPVSHHQPKVIRFDTAQHSVEEIVDQVLPMFAFALKTRGLP